MKKTFSIAGVLLVAALAFSTSCSKDNTPSQEPESGKFSISASLSQTRTTISSDLKSSWADGDAMNVFHAAAGAAEYTDDGKFTYGTSNSKFEGTLGAALTGNSDWYAFYPYSSYITTPANTSTGYSTVGSSAGMAQTQAAKDDPTHLAGKNYPLAGKVANVEKSTVPTVTMKHVCAYAKVEVTNSLSEAIKVSKIEVAMPGKDVTGTYYVNFTDPDNCSFIGSGTSYVSDKAIVSVIAGADIEWGGGIKSEASLNDIFSAGARYAVIGSLAAGHPDIMARWIGKYGSDSIVLGADVRNGKIAVNGWLDSTDLTIVELVGRLPGLTQAICTEISRDGTLKGPDTGLYKRLMRACPDVIFTASGGIGSMFHIKELVSIGVPRVIVGKALYEGCISLIELMEINNKTV